MRAYLKEIILSLVAIAVMLMAIAAYLKVMNQEKANSRVDLFTLAPPTAGTLLVVNRPAVLARMMRNYPLLYTVFAQEIPPIFLSVLEEDQPIRSILFSFHPQGVLACMPVGSKTAHAIAHDILPEKFKPYLPQKQTENGVDFFYYPETKNHFFGYYIHNGIWVGSYSRRLLERAASQQQQGEVLLPREMEQLRTSFDPNAPMNIICPAGELGLGSGAWVSADLFMSEGAFCCYGSLPYPVADSLTGDALARRLEGKYPQLQLSFQIRREEESVALTACSPL
ncbi:MAG: hypothetical protein LBD89_02195 [Tannerellaceae bacterium]|nr:hypothetical protein [Tannerellaceae bacterium]